MCVDTESCRPQPEGPAARYTLGVLHYMPLHSVLCNGVQTLSSGVICGVVSTNLQFSKCHDACWSADWRWQHCFPSDKQCMVASGMNSTCASVQFDSFVADIDAAIAELGGKVLPKLNWSAPKDAVWLKPSRDIACTNADEVGPLRCRPSAMGQTHQCCCTG